MTEATRIALGASINVIGLALIYWSGQLSGRYNAWTSNLRGRHRRGSAEPSSQAHVANVRIVKTLLRILGTFLVLSSIVVLAGV